MKGLTQPRGQRAALGLQLRLLRESRGISVEQAAEAIRDSPSRISGMERGTGGFKERDVSDLLTLYGVTDSEERASLLHFLWKANTPGRWRGRGRVVPVADRLLAAAVCWLPDDDRVRYAEEYRAELWDLAQAGAGRVRQLRYALSQLRNALPTAFALRSVRRRSAVP
jgi:transcriptional regulator with XRE-family HTH domain